MYIVCQFSKTYRQFFELSLIIKLYIWKNSQVFKYFITDLETYDTAGLATYYNTADSLSRPQATPPPPPNIVSQAEARENVMASRGVSGGYIGAISTPAVRAGGGFSLSGLGSTCVDTTDYDEAGRRDDGGGGDIEKYAQDNLNLNCGRPKGLRLLFRKKFSVRDILSWSKDPIPQPMLVVVDGEKLLKREACNLFRLVQVCNLYF